MATPEQVIEFEEARAILRKTLEVSKAAGVSPAVMMGAMVHSMAEFFILAEHAGLPHKSFDELNSIAARLVHDCRG